MFPGVLKNKKNLSAMKSHGFSMIELVVVIILLSIMGVAIMSRFSDSSEFNTLAARDGIIATALAAQQASLGRNDVTFDINQSGSDWIFEVASSGTVVSSFEVTGGGFTLETGSTITTGDCSTGFDDAVTSNFSIAYDSFGNASTFTNAASTPVSIANGVRICIDDTVDLSVCISPGGYAREGDCED